MKKTIIAVVLMSITGAGCTQQRSTTEPTKPSQQIVPDSTIQISSDMREAAQIQEALVELRQQNQRIETTGEIKPDENRVFHMNSLVGGRLASDLVSLGDYVKTNQKLALVENLDVMRISANYIHETHTKDLEIKQSQTRLKYLLANKLRLEKLFNERIAAEKDYFQAQTQLALEEANVDTAIKEKGHQRAETKALLSAYGVSVNDIKNDAPVRFSPILSPKNGFIVKKNITIGDVINSSEPLYVVSDLSQVWLDITIFDRDLSAVKEGASVTFTTDSLPEQRFTGRVDYIKPLAQDSRTFVARAVLQNSKLMLKPGMFGHVEISQIGGIKQPFVQGLAIQSFEGQQVVFVKLPDGSYQCVPVHLGRRLDDGYFVTGLKPGQQVVTRGSYYIKEQFANRAISGGRP